MTSNDQRSKTELFAEIDNLRKQLENCRSIQDKYAELETSYNKLRQKYDQTVEIIQGCKQIDALQIARDELLKSEEKHRRIIETTGEGFLFMDDHLNIVEANDAFCRMLGFERREIVGKTPFDLAADAFKQFLSIKKEDILSRDYRKLEGTMVAKDGRLVPVLIHGNTLKDEAGEKIGNICFISDLTVQKKALALAGKVQQSLIPQEAPQIKGLDVAGRSYSCDEVGGDYFDFLLSTKKQRDILNVVVGDISGHGVDAALLMTSARAYIRMRASQNGGPAKVVTMMNQDLAKDMMNTSYFMTLFFIQIDPVERTVQWVRAGHDPAIIYTPSNDTFDELVGQGIPLGVAYDSEYQNLKRELPPGALIIIGTDGIWESGNADGQSFGKDRFKQAIRQKASERPHTIISYVFDEVFAFTKGLPLEDDLTLVIVKIDDSR